MELRPETLERLFDLNQILISENDHSKIKYFFRQRKMTVRKKKVILLMVEGLIITSIQDLRGENFLNLIQNQVFNATFNYN
jgi:hypothetical protein